jgi:hypothetical protein
LQFLWAILAIFEICDVANLCKADLLVVELRLEHMDGCIDFI